MHRSRLGSHVRLALMTVDVWYRMLCLTRALREPRCLGLPYIDVANDRGASTTRIKYAEKQRHKRKMRASPKYRRILEADSNGDGAEKITEAARFRWVSVDKKIASHAIICAVRGEGRAKWNEIVAYQKRRRITNMKCRNIRNCEAV